MHKELCGKKQYLDDGSNFWKLTLNYYLKTYGQCLLVHCNYAIKNLETTLSPFYLFKTVPTGFNIYTV